MAHPGTVLERRKSVKAIAFGACPTGAGLRAVPA